MEGRLSLEVPRITESDPGRRRRGKGRRGGGAGKVEGEGVLGKGQRKKKNASDANQGVDTDSGRGIRGSSITLGRKEMVRWKGDLCGGRKMSEEKGNGG